MAYDNSNRGVAFVNDKKESDTHPDMKGSINVEGTEYWLSAWWKTPNAGGAEFLSFSIKPKDGDRVIAPAAASTRGKPTAKTPTANGDDDGDIPFAPAYARAAWSLI